ncbi:hypothetical protein Nepgr_028727 [Nepenthes gracilis]|uniref:SPARK domain-containing protein n=1 Tax=Nepenthes gracilis TaxID=150966 RepID=A0AAD3TDF2_NEPGR|nr:hypothetical protein Nepgr_028727 [Nepenthes gracilis]
MRDKRVSIELKFYLLSSLLMLAYVDESFCSSLNYLSVDKSKDAFFHKISPERAPQPLIPLLAPSPLTPFTNYTVPKLSGLCPLNFSAAEAMITVTSTDCLTVLAPYLANVVCCPQLEATLVILIGQSSKNTGMLALNLTLARHCLSDFEQVLVSQGANNEIQQICNIRSSNLTEGSCPVKDLREFENTVDSEMLLDACGKIDVVNECCTQICENALSDAAHKITSKANDLKSASHIYARVQDCRNIALRWLASRLDASRAKEVLRGLSNCNVNKVCPLAFPDTRSVMKKCSNGIRNKTACCGAMQRYVTHLQNQSFTTNLQALNCASALGMKLQSGNITNNIYKLCHIGLKQFSLQAGTQESGCLLQSLPSDVVFDQFSGITFLCDLNDNIPAPWPSANQLPSSSCNKTVQIPALPAAASGQTGLWVEEFHYHLLFALSAVVLMFHHSMSSRQHELQILTCDEFCCRFGFHEQFGSGPGLGPGSGSCLMKVEGISPPLIKSLYRAGAALYRTDPWKRLRPGHLFGSRVGKDSEWPSKKQPFPCVQFIGGDGGDLALYMFRSEIDARDSIGSRETIRVPNAEILRVTYETESLMFPSHRKMIKSLSLEVSGTDRFPVFDVVLCTSNGELRFRDPMLEELRFAYAVIRAMALVYPLLEEVNETP